jgi:hypothetical protein
MQPAISDQEWFEAIANPDAAAARLSLALPGLPPPDIQRGYNGRSGVANLEEAFAFYRHVRRLLPADARIMDFGAGWGRVARFFLRDTAAQNIWAVDPMERSIAWMRDTGLPCTMVQSRSLPPIPGAACASFDLIYAHSVFSHLSEEYLRAWVPYLMSLVAARGALVLTTRGRNFISSLRQRSKRPGWWREKKLYKGLGRLGERYEAGEFIFVGDRGERSELSGRHYGQAFVPEAYFRAAFPALRVEFSEDVAGVAQAVIVARHAE